MKLIKAEDMIQLGELIKEKRMSANEKQRDLGQSSGLSRESISRIELGLTLTISYRKMTYLFADTNIFLHVEGIPIENPTLTEVSEFIKNRRSELGLSLRTLSTASGVNHSTIYDMENYNGKNIAYLKVIKVLLALGAELKINTPEDVENPKVVIQPPKATEPSFSARFNLISP